MNVELKLEGLNSVKERVRPLTTPPAPAAQPNNCLSFILEDYFFPREYKTEGL